MAPNPNHQVVAARRALCISGNGTWGDTEHTVMVKLGDDSELAAEDLIALIEAGAFYHMIPPTGAPAYEAHLRSGGLPLLLQVRTCEHCGKKVLFA